ncbi:vWA domain-containing protein [Gordonia phosphorivorans]|uniref:VWA domain-containing protein n=1 Tax=Gordonia phosphorivorans TaxID=1056982 RepID=A0ABV6H400_9ACTN
MHVYERADAALTELCEQLDVAGPAPRLGAAQPGLAVRVDPGRYRLTDRDLRVDIAAFTGRLRAPRFAAVACAAAAVVDASADAATVGDLSDVERAAVTHLLHLHHAARIRGLGVENVGAVTAAADVLWQPDQYDRDTLLAVGVWDVLPRVDSAVLPAAAVTALYDAVRQQLGDRQFGAWQLLWRRALAGRPTPRRSPQLEDWVVLARQWLELHAETFGGVQVTAAAAPVLTGAELFTPNPVADPLGRQLTADLADAAQQALADSAATAALVGDRPRRPGVGGAVADRDAGGAGGAMMSGQRVLTWREPAAGDRRNLRIFRDGLTVAGHRSPSMAPTPVPYPSGRLNPRQLVARAGQIATGRQVTATPWTAIRPVPRTAEVLRLGVIVDASATMRPWVEMATSLAWAAAHAVDQRGGQHTMWAFGGEAFVVVGDGVAPPKVPVISDPGSGSAGCGAAVTAARSALTGRGAGLLVVITDGLLPDSQDVQDAIDDAHADGFQLVWALAGIGGDRFIPAGVSVVDQPAPAAMAEAITSAALSVLTSSYR